MSAASVPFGQKKRVPVAIEQAALSHLTVFVNGGQRGLQIEIDPNDAAIAAGAVAHALTALKQACQRAWSRCVFRRLKPPAHQSRCICAIDSRKSVSSGRANIPARRLPPGGRGAMNRASLECLLPTTPPPAPSGNWIANQPYLLL